MNKKKAFYVVACTIATTQANGSIVRDDIPYQTYRDFAENRGDFKVGNTNIKIYDKNGKILTVLDKAPMIDFSNAFSPAGYGNFLNTQYISSVRHNGGYKDVKFGRGSTYTYKIVDRNDHPNNDYHLPRVNKLVTEVAPIKSANGLNLMDTNRFTTFYRVGSGTQKIMGKDSQEKYVTGGYAYLTGGVVDKLTHVNKDGVRARGTYLYDADGLKTITQSGDSGSPLYAWDNLNKEWIFVANLTGKGGDQNIWSVNYDFIDPTIKEDYAGEVDTKGGELKWEVTDKDKSKYKLGNLEFTGKDFWNNDDMLALAAGKNISLTGGGKITLTRGINQGAGTLTFKSDMTVQGENDNLFWVGGGVDINEGKTVTWKVKGQKGDSLHKIGKGTLYIDGNGNNYGDISLGDGTLYLSQNGGHAFNNIEIVSGRGKVILEDSNQVESGDNITFGFRGGTLDLNGNSLEFDQINAADDGAIIENSKDTAKITVNPGKIIIKDLEKAPEKDWDKDKTAKKYDIYKYVHNGRTDWFAAKKDGRFSYFPTNQTSNNEWLYLSSSSKEDALKNLQKQIQNIDVAYHGYLKGNIDTDINYVEGSKGTMVFDGGIDTPNGKLKLNNARVSLQGHPEIHAYNTQEIVDKLKSYGDNSLRTQPVYTDQKDWENREFKLNEINTTGSELLVGRNGKVTGTIKASNSKIIFGGDDIYIDKKDGDGLAQDIVKGKTVATGEDRAYYKGNIIGTGTEISMKNAVVDAGITGAGNTKVDIDSNTTWNLLSDSKMEKLTVKNNPEIYLSTENNVGRTLTTDTLDATSQKFHLNTNVTQGTSDKIVVNNQAIGDNNQLLLNLLGDSNAKVTKDILLASAPSGTKDSYFTVPDEVKGFTVYKPNYKVETAGEHKEWKLVKKDESENPNTPETKPNEPSSISGGRTGNNGAGNSGATSVGTGNSGAENSGATSAGTGNSGAENSGTTSVGTGNSGAENSGATSAGTGNSGAENSGTTSVGTGNSGTGNSGATSAGTGNNGAGNSGTTSVGTGNNGIATTGIGNNGILGSYYIPTDNTPYINDVKAVLNTQEAIFINENESLMKRLGDLRSSNGKTGIWFKNNTQENQIEDAKLKSNSMELGFDSKIGNNIYGIFGTYSQGKTELKDGHNDFKYGGVGAYYTYMNDNGAFVDVVGKYLKTSQKIKLPSLTGKAGATSFEGEAKKSPNMFIGSVQTGIRKETKNGFYMEPTVKVTTGYMEGYNIEGKDGTKAKVKSSTPVYGETGVQVGKHWGTEGRGVSVSTGVHYQKKLSKNRELELIDSEGIRKYETMDTDRAVANVSIDGKLTENLGIYGRVEKSFGGKYKTNYSGQVGFRYTF